MPQHAAFGTSPYIVGGPKLDALSIDNMDALSIDDMDELWLRHSLDQRACNDRTTNTWTECKSRSANDVDGSHASVRASISEFISEVAKRHQQPLQHRHSFSSPVTTAPTTTAFRPWSSAGSTASSLGPDDSSGSPLTTTSVRFVGVATIDAHCVFALQVDTSAEQFVVHKRYSQFRAFRQQLIALLQQSQHCGNGPCKQLAQQLATLKFPRRRLRSMKWRTRTSTSTSSSGSDLAVARDRLLQLQRFIDALLSVYRAAPRRQLRCCVNTNCIAIEAVRSFLDISARDDTVVLAPPVRPAELIRVSTDSCLCSSSCPKIGKTTCVDSRGDSSLSKLPTTTQRQTRSFPPPTRVSLAAEPNHHFDQLYTITENSDLVHLHV